MKGNVFLILIILSFIILNQLISSETVADSITGEIVIDPITGKMTSQQVGMSIFIQTVIPYIQITSPKNETYLTNESLFLNYTLINGDYVWYNIDNSENTTISSSIQFNVSQGPHTVYIFANNTNDTITSNVSFTANSSKFIILFEDYKSSTKGSSTNFLNYSYEEIQNLNNIILENTDYGKIKFNEAINMTNDKDNTDNLLDVDSNINISSNRIEINSTEVPNFNKSTTLWLYNLNFAIPRILKDGVVCPSTICTKESYTGNTLKFNVTSFSVYSAEETPTGITEIPSGGGGETSIPIDKYSLDTEEILIYLKQGETTTRYFTIENKDTKKINLIIKSKNLGDLVRINETTISLNPKESKTIKLDFLARDDTNPDLYLGKIIVSSAGTEKEILVMIEVESKSSLFDIKLKIPDKFQYVLPGEEILAQIELYNLGDYDRVDVSLDYIIKDSEGKEIIKEHDTIAVETSTSFIKSIKLPLNLPFGKYVFYTRVNYDNKIASASAWFNIGRKYSIPVKAGITALIIVLIICVIIVLFKIRKIKEEGKAGKKVDASYPGITKIIRK